MAKQVTREESELVSTGVRWARNNLTELIGNYGARLPDKAREDLKGAVRLLQDFDEDIAEILMGDQEEQG